MILISDIAKVCHEVNRAFCESLGDDSQPTWEYAPDWQKESAMNGVLFHINDPDATPADSHANWLKGKFDEGWVYGPNKNPENKTHPCCVPYKDLPTDQRAKDHLFVAVIESMRLLVKKGSQ